MKNIFEILLNKEYYLHELEEKVENASNEEVEAVKKELQNLINDIEEMQQ